MKKAIFYGALVGISILIWLILGAILALIFNGTDYLAYSLGTWCGQPFLILLAIGIALCFRKVLYQGIFKESKEYKSNVPLYIIIAAVLWGCWMIGVKIFYAHAMTTALQNYQP